MRMLLFSVAFAAVFTQSVRAEPQQLRDPVVVGPQQSACSDILDSEKLNYDADRNVIKLDYLHPQRGATYMAVLGWLQGFFSARNLFDLSVDGDITQGTRSLDWMTWMFDYCRAHPNSTLFDAGIGLSNALAKAYRDTRSVAKDSRQP